MKSETRAFHCGGCGQVAIAAETWPRCACGQLMAPITLEAAKSLIVAGMKNAQSEEVK